MEHIKKVFPTHKVYDCTNRNISQLRSAVLLCFKIDTILLFVKRNEKNDTWFELVEHEHKTKYKVNMVFFHKDDIYYFYDANIEHMARYLKRKILDETDCSVCFEKCTNEFLSCFKCGDCTCKPCYLKFTRRICPICRGGGFSHFIPESISN